jgi:predicted metal-dependent HD superfamily phosphohydrolase
MTATPSPCTAPDLASSFHRLATSLHGTDAQAQYWTKDLLALYTEPQRHYHTLSHIAAMQSHLDRLTHLTTYPTALQLAIYFHDAVYTPQAHDNEIASIALFRIFAAELNLPEPLTERVARYIEATISHTLIPDPGADDGEDKDLRLFLDLDLEVLSRDSAAYQLYAQQIRAEYAHLSAEEYAAGRARVLRAFLSRDRVYFSDAFSGSEERARMNLRAEILVLEGGG